MTHGDFNKLLLRRTDLINSVLAGKADEYSVQDDRLYNFKRAAEMLQSTPERALFGMLAKHLVSVYDLVHEKKELTQALVDEKIGDCINYFILLEALFAEKLEFNSFLLEGDK